ncbi:unnamed protein product [Rotaria sp. Silwood1]|nr:unnamed protein product [Rotaria sp. Silwood1]CAF1652316.1 unnamed protein product [Rotaria sp. Silwood1]
MRSKLVILFCFIAIIYPVTLLDPCCKGKLNTNEILHEEPRFINSIRNGKPFVVGQDYEKINIVHVYGGTPYDVGYAFSQLMSEDFKQLLVAKWIAEYGLPGTLDLNYDIARKYTPPWYNEELQDLAAGSGV